MIIKKDSQYIVIRKTHEYHKCESCKGTGINKRSFRKMNFVEDCPVCKGNGKEKITITEEVSLSEALAELIVLSNTES